MSLNGANWSRNNESAHCDISQKAVLGRPGGQTQKSHTRTEIPMWLGYHNGLDFYVRRGVLDYDIKSVFLCTKL